ncbi:hypothetical protein ACPA9J_27100 [Pseudomonas aeruginosa]
MIRLARRARGFAAALPPDGAASRQYGRPRRRRAARLHGRHQRSSEPVRQARAGLLFTDADEISRPRHGGDRRDGSRPRRRTARSRRPVHPAEATSSATATGRRAEHWRRQAMRASQLPRLTEPSSFRPQNCAPAAASGAAGAAGAAQRERGRRPCREYQGDVLAGCAEQRHRLLVAGPRLGRCTGESAQSEPARLRPAPGRCPWRRRRRMRGSAFDASSPAAAGQRDPAGSPVAGVAIASASSVGAAIGMAGAPSARIVENRRTPGVENTAHRTAVAGAVGGRHHFPGRRAPFSDLARTGEAHANQRHGWPGVLGSAPVTARPPKIALPRGLRRRGRRLAKVSTPVRARWRRPARATTAPSGRRGKRRCFGRARRGTEACRTRASVCARCGMPAGVIGVTANGARVICAGATIPAVLTEYSACRWWSWKSA